MHDLLKVQKALCKFIIKETKKEAPGAILPEAVKALTALTEATRVLQ